MTPRVQTTTPAVILKLVHPSAALGIARSLGRLGVPVIGVHPNRQTPIALSRYLGALWPWDTAKADDEATVAFLCERARSLGTKPVLFPVDDHGTLLVSRYAESLRDAFLLPEQPTGLPERLGDKASLHQVAQELGVPTPDAAFPKTRQELVEYTHKARLPLVVKPIDSGCLNRAKVSIAETRSSLLRLADALDDEQIRGLMLQEYIPGGIDCIWMFNGYFDSTGRCLFGATGRKLRQFPPYTGMTSLGVCVPNRLVHELSQRWLGELGYRGIVDMGYRFDERDGQYKVLDVNPRIGATFRLFAGPDGMDVARALYLDVTGQPVRESHPRPGRKWIVEPFDLASSYRYWRDGTLSPHTWLRSLRKIEEAAWLSRDDPKPFLAMCASYALTMLRRSTASVRRTAAAKLADDRAEEDMRGGDVPRKESARLEHEPEGPLETESLKNARGSRPQAP